MFPNFKNLFKGIRDIKGQPLDPMEQMKEGGRQSGALGDGDFIGVSGKRYPGNSTVPDKDRLKRMFSAPTGGDAITTTNQMPSAEPQARPLIPMIAPEVRTPVQETQSRIDEIYGKDYSIKKDDEGNVIHRGKDRDKKWSLGDKILSGFMGAFNGDGIIPAATDRNYMERQADKRELGQLVPQVKQQQQAEDFGRDQKYKQTQIEINQIKPEVMLKDAETKAERVRVTAKYNDLRAKLGQQKADDWKWAQEALIEHRKGTLVLRQEQVDLLERRIQEIERHNKVTEEDTDLNRESREKVAANRDAAGITKAQMKESGVAERAKQKLSQMDAAAKQKAIDGAVQRWMQQNKGATADQIANVRKQLQDTYK
jgi:hypothetical protein